MSSGIMVLPKLTIQNLGKMTSILASEIVGVEPCDITFKGKKFQGSKCYTVHGESFKVFADPTMFVANWHLCKNDAGMLSVLDAPINLPGYTNEAKALIGQSSAK
jgi:hypothetical protein